MTEQPATDCTGQYFDCLARRGLFAPEFSKPELPTPELPRPELPELGPDMFDYRATCDRLVGPLTLHCDVDIGFHVHIRTLVRLDGLTQPTREDRPAVIAFVTEWLDKHDTFTLQSIASKREKFGRWLGIVRGDDGSVLNAELITANLVGPYQGGPGATPFD